MPLNKCARCDRKLSLEPFRQRTMLPELPKLVMTTKGGGRIRYCNFKCKDAHHHTGTRRYKKHVQKLRNKIKYLKKQSNHYKAMAKMRGYGEN